MLSVKFQLTPAQTEMLLVMYAGNYRRLADDPSMPLLPEYDSTRFVGVGQKLIAKGLATHCNDRSPTWLLTPEGEAMAALVVREAKRIVDMCKNRRPVKAVARR